ncbi:MAG: hypothetical protein RIM99_04805 [Cyclobacteriaceae bacterium]
MKKSHYIFTTLFIFSIAACEVPGRQETDPEAQTESVVDDGRIMSFLGSELTPKELEPETKLKYEKNLAEAEQALTQYPDSLDLIIWYGRRLAYLGQLPESIQVYTDGLSKYPQSYRLRRHRGHRYITTRQIDKAIADFELAAFYSTRAKNQVEPDGLPNKLNQPLGNDFFNIYYHFGLAHYLNGRFDKAVSAYNKCMEFSDNDDLLAATSYWLYMSARRVGNDDLATEVLNKISPTMKMVENDAYLDLLLLFKGTKSEEELIKIATNEDGTLNPTVAYGIGNWYLQNNRIDDARNLFWKTLESPAWDAFGYIATEADINNMATSSTD